MDMNTISCGAATCLLQLTSRPSLKQDVVGLKDELSGYCLGPGSRLPSHFTSCAADKSPFLFLPFNALRVFFPNVHQVDPVPHQMMAVMCIFWLFSNPRPKTTLWDLMFHEKSISNFIYECVDRIYCIRDEVRIMTKM